MPPLRVLLPRPTPIEDTAPMKELFTRRDNVGSEFCKNIHAYNNIFAFTSIGTKLDDELANDKEEIYIFRIHRGIYHSIGSLIPNNNEKPKFMQLYIYDTEHETNNRLAIMPELCQDVLEIIKLILDQFNLFVTNFHSIAIHNNITNLRLLFRANYGLDQRKYNTQTASQVAAIWVEGYNPEGFMKRDIIVKSRSQGLQYISELSGSYNIRFFSHVVIMVGIRDNAKHNSEKSNNQTILLIQIANTSKFFNIDSLCRMTFPTIRG
ncbi:11509_t:CDS:2 [Dentiscutata erythropus]|uniref:11509_t:CDS:1 n=1 Tax=Dentiscutata erythropus TaxID=1348616 RepID=A0A9N9EE87_9GLOM|nr:11509_t:CDS:2 [Dentiscutata erythropus]